MLSMQGRYIRRTTIFIFSFCIGLVTHGLALGVLKHHYITKRICELLMGNSRFLIYNSLNQLLYKRKLPYRALKDKCSKSSSVCFLKQSE